MIMVMRSQIFAVLVSVLVWLLLGCSLSYATQEDIDCLRSIKDSLDDSFGYLNSSWNFDNTTEGFICRFTGIDCWHPDENRVLNIRLADMGLKGVFPQGIAKCKSITGLDLSSNKLYGPIPSNISQIIYYVTSLDLSSNNFSGEIPPALANCSFLNILKLDYNSLTGSIPPVLSLLNRIKAFSVSNNLLSGPIPYFNVSLTAEDFAHNPGLCGKPLDPCQSTSKGPKTGIIAGAAVAGVTVAAIGVAIGMFFYYRRVSVMRKKKDDDPEGNKWAKSLKGDKGIKASLSNTSMSDLS
ncbi:hypothetical protein Gotri_018500 [Gossypium trilobum]|uniref:Leucine-rich repeat-containing N-terminal plant-type domain-containing protein n=1 Tax=Gossypium trilobum TaxID=34281 RepID=A0A7J9E9U7_9ROSI|nr:hypothetical protein [Gossypium trilobum]